MHMYIMFIVATLVRVAVRCALIHDKALKKMLCLSKHGLQKLSRSVDLFFFVINFFCYENAQTNTQF